MSGEAHKDAGEHEAKPSETTAPEETETTKPASQEEVENEVVEKGPDKATAPDKSTEQQYLEVLVSEGKEAQQTQPGAFPPSILLVLGLATVGSYLLFKFVKLRVAERVKRWVPLFHVVIWCLAIIIMGAIAIRRASVEWMLFGLSLLFTLVALNLNWLRSVLAGVALTFEHHLEVGDSIRLGDLEGDIVHFGLRATRIRAIDGTLHDVPNAQLLTDEIANLSGDGSDSACRIQVILPPHLSIERARELALEAAILSPLASPRHRPEVFLGEHMEVGAPVKLMIRGYAFDPNYQDHFRSDVIERVTKMFAAAK
jgi:hypothetical protein